MRLCLPIQSGAGLRKFLREGLHKDFVGNPPFHRQTGIAHGEEQRSSALPLDDADLDTGDNAQFGQSMGCLMTSRNGNHSEARSRLSHGQRTHRGRRTIEGRLIPRLRGRLVCTAGVGIVPLATMLLLRTAATMSLSPSSPSKWYKAMMSDHNEMAAQETTALADGGSAAVLLSVVCFYRLGCARPTRW